MPDLYYWIPFLVLSIQGFFISAIFFSKIDKRSRAVVWIAFVVLLISLQLLFFSFGYGGYYQFASFLFGLPSLVPMLFGPVFYFFFRERTKGTAISIKDLIHLIPALLFVVFNSGFFMTTVSVKAVLIEEMFLASSTGHYLSGRSLLNTAFLVGTNLFYWTISLKLVKHVEDDNPTKALLKYVLIFFGLYIIGLAVYRFMLFFGMSYDSVFCFLLKVYMGLTLYVIAYRFLTFSDKALLFQKTYKYRYSTLTEQRKDEIWDKVENYLRNESNFLKSDLKLSKIGRDLDIPPNYISQVVNERNEGGFNRLVNELRIEFSKQLLATSDLKIYAIALESGFGNKNTFNEEFKRLVGCTPSTFRTRKKSQKL